MCVCVLSSFYFIKIPYIILSHVHYISIWFCLHIYIYKNRIRLIYNGHVIILYKVSWWNIKMINLNYQNEHIFNITLFSWFLSPNCKKKNQQILQTYHNINIYAHWVFCETPVDYNTSPVYTDRTLLVQCLWHVFLIEYDRLMTE